MVSNVPKGTFQKLLSGFFPLRVFGQGDFPLRGGGGYPPMPLRKIPLKSRYFRSENSIFFNSVKKAERRKRAEKTDLVIQLAFWQKLCHKELQATGSLI